MWIINEDGFFSAVQDWNNDQFLYVRGRAESDLQTFVQTATDDSNAENWKPEIISTPERDYQWRVYTSKTLWAKYLAQKATDISYGNFKDHCSDTWHTQQRDARQQKLSVLHDAWFLFNLWPDHQP